MINFDLYIQIMLFISLQERELIPRSILCFWIANMSFSCWNRLTNTQKIIIYLSMTAMIKKKMYFGCSSRTQICWHSCGKKLTNTLTQACFFSGIILAWNNFLQAKLQSWTSMLLHWQQWWTFNYYRLPLSCNYSLLNCKDACEKKNQTFLCSLFLVFLTAQRTSLSLKNLEFFSIFLN